ncbi:MAG: YfcE family phosphodiesterase [Phycisphaerales bacterium]|nr:YfcE family phosphodiesterase [Phycisphaerales bacterium]
MDTQRLGLLSDTHGRVEAASLAVRVLVERGATMLIHLGDIGSDSVLEELASIESHVVFGNCDLEEDALARHAERLGISVHHPAGRLVVDGRTIAFTHGHLPELLNRASAEGVDYILHGHTHEQRDERRGRSRIINPGALHRASPYSVAILVPATDTLEFIAIEEARR